MTIAVIPLIPLVWMGIGALVGGGAVAVATHEWDKKPPYENADIAYKNYVKAIEEKDYKRYQWTVSDPIDESAFLGKCSRREKLKLAPVKEGVGDVQLFKGKTEGKGTAFSPWDRIEKTINFKKVGDSWKVVEG